jgi:hypothetical protein
MQFRQNFEKSSVRTRTVQFLTFKICPSIVSPNCHAFGRYNQINNSVLTTFQCHSGECYQLELWNWDWTRSRPGQVHLNNLRAKYHREKLRVECNECNEKKNNQRQSQMKPQNMTTGKLNWTQHQRNNHITGELDNWGKQHRNKQEQYVLTSLWMCCHLQIFFFSPYI